MRHLRHVMGREKKKGPNHFFFSILLFIFFEEGQARDFLSIVYSIKASGGAFGSSGQDEEIRKRPEGRCPPKAK